MKRSLYIFILLALGFAVTAQTQQGAILVGANLYQNGSTTQDLDTADTKTKENRNTSFGLNLRGGYFIADNFAVGLLLGYDASGSKSETITSPTVTSTNTKKSSGIKFGAFARMYQPLGESKFKVFGQLDLTYRIGNSSDESVSVAGNTSTTFKFTGKSNTLGLNLAPGVAYFFNNKFALEATIGSLGFSMTTNEDYDNAGRLDGSTKVNNTNVSLVPLNLGGITVGLTWFFGGGDSSN